MKAGRPGLPAITKQLQGTDRKDREKEGINFTLITVCPKPQVWLDGKAKRYFKQFCNLLIGKGMLTDANVGHVLIMAQEFAKYESATRELNKNGYVITTGKNDYEQPSPFVAIANNAQKNYRDIASLFGLDPVSASKIVGTKKVEKDDFEQMQNKYSQQT